MRIFKLLSFVVVLLLAVVSQATTSINIKFNQLAGRKTAIPAVIKLKLSDIQLTLKPAQTIKSATVQVTFIDAGKSKIIAAQCDILKSKKIAEICFFIPPQADKNSVFSINFNHQTRPKITHANPLKLSRNKKKITISNNIYTIEHNSQKKWLLSSIIYNKNGKRADSYKMGDRIYNGTSYFFAGHKNEALAKVIIKGPLRCVVKVVSLYAANEKVPSSIPQATYLFEYFAGSSIINIRTALKQDKPTPWNEILQVGFEFKDDTFTAWLDKSTKKPVKLVDNKMSRTPRWGALVDGQNNILAMMPEGTNCKIYDGKTSYVTGLFGPWIKWNGLAMKLKTTLWIGSTSDYKKIGNELNQTGDGEKYTVALSNTQQTPVIIERIVKNLPTTARDYAVTFNALKKVKNLSGSNRLRERAQFINELDKLSKIKPLPLKKIISLLNITQFKMSKLIIAFRKKPDGIKLLTLFDLKNRQLLIAPNAEPLWRLTLGDKELTSNLGWTKTSIVKTATDTLKLNWQQQTTKSKQRLLNINCQIKFIENRSSWQLAVVNNSKKTLRKIIFPNWSIVTDPSNENRFVLPFRAGILKKCPMDKVRYSGLYPQGWTSTMQFMAYYNEQRALYIGFQDPHANIKTFFANGDKLSKTITVGCSFPAPNAGIAGNDWNSPGSYVLIPFKGNWFDAAQIYKNWVKKHADWWPRSKEHKTRQQAMGKICVWQHVWAEKQTTTQVKAEIKRFAEYMQIPIGVHWYWWHEIPFDQYYPHYFPTQPGFAKAVKELQQDDITIMPYINGRLWDTACDDFEKIARRGATKNADGSLLTQSFQDHTQAVMCPTTNVWQNKMQEIILKLAEPPYAVKAVYIDQIGASRPTPCADKSHGHPLVGGNWWAKGYWQMLTTIRKKIPAKTFLTTECVHEVYLHVIDGFLAWSHRDNDMIPLFAAVYNSKTQLFGRNYSSKCTGPATWAVTGQAFAFGEQLGWINSGVLSRTDDGAFLRQLAQLRYKLLDFMAWGEMARPPKVSGNIPQITSTWKDGKVTLSALQCSAWRSKNGDLALVFVNITKQPLTFKLDFTGASYGISTKTKFKQLIIGQPDIRKNRPVNFSERITLAPLQAMALVNQDSKSSN